MDLQKQIEKELSDLCGNRRHPIVDYSEFINEVDTLFEKYKNDLEEIKKGHSDLQSDDWIKNKLTELFESRVCEQLGPKDKEAVRKEGNNRYQTKTPPGYKDSNKPIPDRYGDLILWFEVIEFSKKQNKPIIFVTDDRKEDWWYIHNGKTIGPRPELINEFISQTGMNFYMYSADRFMFEVRNYLGKQIQDQTIEEIEDIRIQEEKTQIQIKQQNEEMFNNLLASKRVIDMMDAARQNVIPKNMINMMDAARQNVIPKNMIDMMDAARQNVIPKNMIDMMDTARQNVIPKNMIDMMDTLRQNEEMYNNLLASERMINLGNAARQYDIPQNVIDNMVGCSARFYKIYTATNKTY